MTTRDACRGDEVVELYFYDELTPAERAEADAHFAVCRACRESLAALHTIETALASRSAGAQPEGGWTAFMSRLDRRIDTLDRRTSEPPNLRTTSLLRVAAAVALVAGGALGGWTLSRSAPADPVDPVAGAWTQIEGAIADAGGSGLDRARVVLAGLAQKDEGEEWSLERRMAATLLPEVRLIRQVSADRGRGGLTDILVDLETLLMQASYAETDDPETLARLRAMIDRRDLLMRLSLAAGIEPPRADSHPRRGL